jgi:hypothetical protein
VCKTEILEQRRFYTMYLFAAFESSFHVEIALEKCKENGIDQNSITVVCMNENEQARNIADTIYHSNGISLFDGMVAWAVMFATLGCVYGSVMKIGPLAMGLIGVAIGAVIGFFMIY